MPLTFPVLAVVTSAIGAIVFAVCVLWSNLTPRRPSFEASKIRQKLPNSLDNWRVPGRTRESEAAIWSPLEEVFRARGLVMWPLHFACLLNSPDNSYPLSSGYGYATSSRGMDTDIGTPSRLKLFEYINALTRVARTREGHDVTVRVIVIRNEGYEHLKILRKIATGPISLISNNHALPLFAEIQFEDIIFGIFPKVGATMLDAFGFWAKNSVGDVVDMLMQALEALAFLHASNIAHRDAFHDNFLIQWQPESMRTMTPAVSRPRVYLIDFEVAVEFPPECPPEQRTSMGYPLGGSFTQPEMYCRPLAPEMTASHPYCPFKLDVWQFGSSFANFKTNIEEIDGLIGNLVCPDPASRMNADMALERLGNVVSAISPASLLIHPFVNED